MITEGKHLEKKGIKKIIMAKKKQKNYKYCNQRILRDKNAKGLIL